MGHRLDSLVANDLTVAESGIVEIRERRYRIRLENVDVVVTDMTIIDEDGKDLGITG